MSVYTLQKECNKRIKSFEAFQGTERVSVLGQSDASNLSRV